MPTLGTTEMLIIAVILLVLFGGSRLPRFARSLGEARRELRATEASERSSEDEERHV